jgi:signal peptidase II
MAKFRNSALFFVLILFDQLSKYIIRHNGGFYICNSGLTFGLRLPSPVFFFAWFLIIALIVFFLFKQGASETIFLLLILCGAVSNMLDRIAIGCVIDFIDLKFWPVFNLADVFITTGAAMLIYRNIGKPKKN